MAKAQSRFSVARLENILEKATKHMNGIHLKNPDYRKRGKVFGQKLRLATEIQKRRNTAKMRGY